MAQIIPKNPILFGIYISKIHKKWAILALLCVTAAALLGGRINLIILGNLTNSLAAKPISIDSVWMWAVLYPIIFFITENIWRASGFSGMRWFMNFQRSAYEALYEYLTLHSKDYFNSRFAGSLTNKIYHAVDGTESLFEKILWQFIPLMIGLIWYIVFAWFTNAALGAIITLWTVLFLGLNIWFSKKLRPRSYSYAKALSTLKGRLVDSLSNISLVQEYAFVSGEREYIKKFIKKQHQTGLDHWRLSEWMLATNGIAVFIFMVLMIWTSVYLFQNNIVRVGTIIVIIAMVKDLSDQLLFLGQELRDAARFYGEAKEGLEEILKEHIIIDAPNAIELKSAKGTISIDAIDFQYENNQVFKDFSLSIPSGQKVGLVGRSGAGKTTFVSLLLRHYDVHNGAIKIDEQNISGITLESLRSSIAFVPQDTSLFHRTIQENIRYSSPDSTKEDVISASKAALADEFIDALPNGYETLVGERGVKLSGGQRQRIAIARAFLKNAPILVLDEATSSLDSQSEHAIQLSLEKLMKGRTVIAIAHRLSTLKKMDRIVVIENGKIVEDGNPDSLLQKTNGIFKNMWEHQVKGFIVD